MISFKDNFFFFRFATLFFILTIFGYWGLDLNSEELYIAFSFFVLVIAVFILVRNGILFFFVKSINSKYARILLDLLTAVAALRLQVASLTFLGAYLSLFLTLVKNFVSFLINFVKSEVPLFAAVYTNKFLFLQALVGSNVAVFVRNCVRARRSAIFFGKFFDINI